MTANNIITYRVSGAAYVPSTIAVSTSQNGHYCRAIRVHVAPTPGAPIALDPRVNVKVTIIYFDDLLAARTTYTTGATMPNNGVCDIDLTCGHSGLTDYGSPIALTSSYGVTLTVGASFIATITVQTIS
jgi:hypothetical protein